MGIGNMLRDREIQYVAMKDETTQTWRVLDTWHEELKNLDPEDDVSDESKAVSVLTEGQFLAIVKEAARLGVLQNVNLSNVEEVEELEDKILGLEEEISDLKTDATKHKTETNILKQEPTSESFMIKKLAMNNIMKLAAIDDVNKLAVD
jgi:SMC interacting uncharacterized protein involved in chromosome segregation